MIELFVTCGALLEPILEAELRELGYVECVRGFRGVNVRVDSLTDVYRINYESRIGTRVLLPLHHFRAYDKNSLYNQACAIDWMRYLKLEQTFAIDAHVSHRAFSNTLFAAQVVKDALCDRFREHTGERPSVNTYNPEVQFNLFLNESGGVISIDTSGGPLHKRGYRSEGGVAPLQENLAAALLKMACLKENDSVCDPCCGSGTFLIEAAMMKTQTPAGFLRSQWGFMKLPDFDASEWERVKTVANQKIRPLKGREVFGNDINRAMVQNAKTNCRLAGFGNHIEISYGDLKAYAPPAAPTFIIANPPYGIRLDDPMSLAPLYRDLGQFMKLQSAKPSRGFILAANNDLTKEVGLATTQRHLIDNGGIDGRLLEYDIY